MAILAQREGRRGRACAMAGVALIAFFGTTRSPASEPSALRMPLGLDARALVIPEDNPLTPEKVALGKQLFFDKRWSRTQTVSCSSCHDPDKGWSDDRRYSLDHQGIPTPRHAPTIINRAFSKVEGWTGHRETTEDLLLNLPFTSAEAVSRHLAPIREYDAQFQRVFGSGVTAEGVAKAIAAFQRTILSGNSAYDRFNAGDAKALSDSARRGLVLFEGKARCAKCHSGFNLTDEAYHNIGVGMADDKPDAGRFAITRRKVNLGAFKTPTLRDVARRGPYMHDGSLATLPEVIAYYDRGGVQNPTLSPEIAPLKLSADEKRDLLAFLESLTGVVDRKTSARPVLPQ